MSAIFTALSSMVIAGRQLYADMEYSRLGNIIRSTKLPKLDTLIAHINEPVSTSELAHRIKALATDDAIIASPACVYMKNLVSLLAYHADVVLEPAMLDNPSEANKKRKAELDAEFENLYKTYSSYFAFTFAMKGFNTILAEVREQTATEKKLAEEIKRLGNEEERLKQELNREKFIEAGFLSKNRELEEYVLRLTLDNKSLKNQMESKSGDIEALKSEMRSSADATAELRDENDDLQTKLIELQNQLLASQSAQQKQVQAISKAFNDTNDLASALAAAKSTIESLEKALLRKTEDAEKTRAHLVLEHAESKSALNKKLNEMKSNFEAVTLKLTELTDVQANYEAVVVKLHAAQEEVVKIRREMVAALGQAGQDKASAEMKIADLTTQMDEQTKKATAEYDSLREKGTKLVKNLRATIEDLKQQIAKQALSITEFEAQIKTLTSELEKAIDERDHKTHEATSLASLASQLSQTISELKEEIIGLRTQKEEKASDKTKIKVVPLSSTKVTLFTAGSKPAAIVAPSTSPTFKSQPGKSQPGKSA